MKQNPIMQPKQKINLSFTPHLALPARTFHLISVSKIQKQNFSVLFSKKPLHYLFTQKADY